jgi:Leucine-rich repeat (LRR) protein
MPIVCKSLAGQGLTVLPDDVLSSCEGAAEEGLNLDLSHNALESGAIQELSARADLVGLRLKILDVSSNQMTEFPDAIMGKKALVALLISSNLLSVLPPGLGELNQISMLDVSRNKLEDIPSSMGSLTLLTQLKAADNQLKSLPPDVGHLASLVFLDVSGNKLRQLPAELGNCENLEELKV